MEFFERAHVLKKNRNSTKGKKTEKKKQLKQMLRGYKHNDNELIKSALRNDNDPNESQSINSYSDLDISELNSDMSNLQEASQSNLNISYENISDTGENVENHLSFSAESNISDSIISENSTEDDVQHLEDSDEVIFESEDSLSIDSKSLTTTSSDNSLPFDVDGQLALTILKNLKEKNKSQNINKKSKVRGMENNIIQTKVDKVSEENFNNDEQEINQYIDLHRTEGSIRTDSEIDEIDTYIDIYNSSRPKRTSHSTSYVSIQAPESPRENLYQILGEYKHSTVVNIPLESTTTNFSSMFINKVKDSDAIINECSDNTHQTSLPSDVDNTFTNDEYITDLDTEYSHIEELDESNKTDLSNWNDSDEIMDNQGSSSENLDSTLIEPVKVYYCNKTCIFVLKHPIELYFLGKFNVNPLAGTVEISGYTLKKPCTVYAPNDSYAHYLRTVNNENHYYGLFSKLTNLGLSVTDTEEIVTTLGNYDAVIQLLPLKSRKINFVDNNFPNADLFSIIDKNIEGCFLKASNILGCSFYLGSPWKHLKVNDAWNQILDLSSDQLKRGIICGGKGVGKSTFLRYYVNRRLCDGPVLVIDLDPGQCEFTVAGNISATVVTGPILGPNFTHLTTPDRMLNIGLINVMDNLRRYTNAVTELINLCNTKQYENMPWIVNTMGMCNGLGLKLLLFIIMSIKPTFLFQIDSKILKKKFECSVNAKNLKALYNEQYKYDHMFRDISVPDSLDYFFISCQHGNRNGKNNGLLSPRDERYLNYLAYFGELLDIHKRTGFLGVIPYVVSIENLYVASNIELEEASICQILNGKIVALCSITPRNSVIKTFRLQKDPLPCYGYGLVRGVDAERGQLYIVTPLPHDKLATVNTVLYCDWTPELQTEREIPAGTRVPYRAPPLQHQHQLMRTPRRRFNPLQLLKVTRNA